MEETKVKIIKVSSSDTGIRLDRWFKRNNPDISHIAIEKALRKGQVRVDGKRCKANFRLEEGMEIKIPAFLETKTKNYSSKQQDKKEVAPGLIDLIKKAIIFQDKDIIVLNKPEGIPVQGGTKIKFSIDDCLPFLTFGSKEIPKLVHRLDRDTSGVLILARSANVAGLISREFKERKVEKNYLAVVVGIPKLESGRINLPLLKGTESGYKEKVKVNKENGLRAITDYKVVDKISDRAALVSLKPITGRTHQLRVHMCSQNTPILGDAKYGGSNAFIRDIEGLSDKLHLHAASMKLMNYSEFKAELPKHFKQTLKFLGLSVN